MTVSMAWMFSLQCIMSLISCLPKWCIYSWSLSTLIFRDASSSRGFVFTSVISSGRRCHEEQPNDEDNTVEFIVKAIFSWKALFSLTDAVNAFMLRSMLLIIQHLSTFCNSIKLNKVVKSFRHQYTLLAKLRNRTVTPSKTVWFAKSATRRTIMTDAPLKLTLSAFYRELFSRTFISMIAFYDLIICLSV